MQLGDKIIQVVRTVPLGTGMRSVWYLPNGLAIHAIEDDPIPLGVYFLNPDDTGRFQNWVIECEWGTRVAVYHPDAAWRKHVEVHTGNTLSDTKACTLPGMEVIPTGVSNSAKALKLMRRVLRRDATDPPTWIIEITGRPL